MINIKDALQREFQLRTYDNDWVFKDDSNIDTRYPNLTVSNFETLYEEILKTVKSIYRVTDEPTNVTDMISPMWFVAGIQDAVLIELDKKYPNNDFDRDYVCQTYGQLGERCRNCTCEALEAA